MRVVVLQHEPIEGPGVWMDALLAEGADVRATLVPKTGVPEAAEEADLLISMGGSMSVNDRLPWIAEEVALLERRIRSERPTLGVCLGSQLIARAAGGTVEAGPLFEIGFQEVELTVEGQQDRVTTALPRSFRALQWHGEFFRDIPDAVPLASSSHYPMQAFRVGGAYGLLFHLEATLHSIAEMARAFPADLERGGIVNQALLDQARLELPRIHEHARRLIRNLLAA
jgi:GMP synthase (glutamine-hydrolysing)